MPQALSGSCTPSPWIWALRMVNHYLDCFVQMAFISGTIIIIFFWRIKNVLGQWASYLKEKQNHSLEWEQSRGIQSDHSLTGHKNQVKEKGSSIIHGCSVQFGYSVVSTAVIHEPQPGLPVHHNSQNSPKLMSIEWVMHSVHTYIQKYFCLGKSESIITLSDSFF